MNRFGIPNLIRNTIATAFRTVVVGLAVYGGIDLVHGAFAQDEHVVYLPVAHAQAVKSLDDRVAELEGLLTHVSRVGDDITITGANLHVVNGTGTTDGGPNALGNVIIGYDELRGTYGPGAGENYRSGSHMLVLGSRNNFTSFGGIVAGLDNSTSGRYSSAAGGASNTASGDFSSISGGGSNLASGHLSSVSGGQVNTASGQGSSVSGGGAMNDASGVLSSVSGGYHSTASGDYASVSGGSFNAARGDVSSVTGGHGNIASGHRASVGGGADNEAGGAHSSISGGQKRAVGGEYNWRAGNLFEEN